MKQPHQAPRLFAFADSVQFVLAHDVKSVADGDRRGANPSIHVVFGEQFLLFSVSEDKHGTGIIAEIHLAVSPVRRTPALAPGVMYPVDLAGLGIEAMKVAGQFARI